MRYSVCLHHHIPFDVLDEYYCPECHYSHFLNMKHFIPYPIRVSHKQDSCRPNHIYQRSNGPSMEPITCILPELMKKRNHSKKALRSSTWTECHHIFQNKMKEHLGNYILNEWPFLSSRGVLGALGENKECLYVDHR